MKISKQKVAANRSAIVDAAIRSFKHSGFDSVGVGDIMRAAGLTPGGFYNHFDSKEMLFAEAVAAAFASQVAFVDGVSADEDELGRAIDQHLSRTHRDAPADGCPTSTLLADAARQGASARGAFASGVADYVRALERGMKTEPSPRSAALATLATMVGSMMLSRAIGDADEELSRAFLTAARKKLRRDRRARQARAARLARPKLRKVASR